MVKYELARNLILKVEAIDPLDEFSNILYWAVSAPVSMKGFHSVSIQVGITDLDLAGQENFLDVYLQGSNDLETWPVVRPSPGSLAVLMSLNEIGSYPASVSSIGFRYVRALYHINNYWFFMDPPLPGVYFVLDVDLNTSDPDPE